MRILIADDDSTSRIMLVGVLKKSGYEVLATHDGASAWDALQQPDAPVLVILDWMMPEMDGLEVISRVRSLQTDHPPYIIMLTSKDNKADIIAGLDAGANDYLAKPFDVGELRARVEVGRRMIEMQDELIKNRETLTHQANYDMLTGLPNRRTILERLHQEILRAGRYNDALFAGMCDIDHFKLINDTYGHLTGDDVLREFGKIMNNSIREYDLVGRMGGEEFLVIAPIKAGMDCISVFNRLCSNVAETKISTRSGLLSVTLSIGVVCVAGTNTVDKVLEIADAALYQAKKDGRNRVVFNDQCSSPEDFPSVS